MFCCTLLYVHSSIAIILMGKRELVALLNLSSLCLVMVKRLFLAMPRGCMRFVIVVFPDHTHLLFFLNEEILSSGITTRSYPNQPAQLQRLENRILLVATRITNALMIRRGCTGWSLDLLFSDPENRFSRIEVKIV